MMDNNAQSILENHIRAVPDFPKPGIMFRDIAPLLASAEVFSTTIDLFAERLKGREFDVIAGVESRGFIFASALAAKMGKGFVPVRKRGKLPPPFITESYTLEYGADTLEMQPGKGRLVLVDDVLATGGTIKTALNLCERAGYTVEDLLFLINLRELNTMRWQGAEPFSLITY